MRSSDGSTVSERGAAGLPLLCDDCAAAVKDDLGSTGAGEGAPWSQRAWLHVYAQLDGTAVQDLQEWCGGAGQHVPLLILRLMCAQVAATQRTAPDGMHSANGAAESAQQAVTDGAGASASAKDLILCSMPGSQWTGQCADVEDSSIAGQRQAGHVWLLHSSVHCCCLCAAVTGHCTSNYRAPAQNCNQNCQRSVGKQLPAHPALVATLGHARLPSASAVSEQQSRVDLGDGEAPAAANNPAPAVAEAAAGGDSSGCQPADAAAGSQAAPAPDANGESAVLQSMRQS